MNAFMHDHSMAAAAAVIVVVAAAAVHFLSLVLFYFINHVPNQAKWAIAHRG